MATKASGGGGGGGLLSRLRTAVKKISIIILNLNLLNQRWRVASMLSVASRRRRPLSFNDRSSNNNYGLRACTSSSGDLNSISGSPVPALTRSSSSSASRSRGGLSRTTSFPEEEDIDKRAELFIANFYRQLRMEKQVSLQLRYCRHPPEDSSSSSTSSSTQFSPT